MSESEDRFDSTFNLLSKAVKAGTVKKHQLSAKRLQEIKNIQRKIESIRKGARGGRVVHDAARQMQALFSQFSPQQQERLQEILMKAIREEEAENPPRGTRPPDLTARFEKAGLDSTTAELLNRYTLLYRRSLLSRRSSPESQPEERREKR